MGGVGRTGTVAACALVAAGWTPDEAITQVRQVRHPTAVETAAQVGFVRDYASGR
jgi:protein-tyrosine phosphatase